MTLKQRLTAFVIALVAIAIAALTTLAYKGMRDEIISGITFEIESAMHGNKEAIARWLNQRQDAISSAAQSVASASDPRSFLNQGKDAGRFEQTFAGYADKRMIYNAADKKPSEGFPYFSC